MTKTTLQAELSADWTAGIGSAPAVLLHGYGSNERDLASLAPALQLALPWVSLRAPLTLGHGGAAWFAIITPGNPTSEPVVAGTDAIWTWIDSHVAPDTKVVPIGFSQGGLMASQLLRNRPERVIAPVILGGFVFGDPQLGDDQLAKYRPAVFWGRGAEDRVITDRAIDRTAEYLPGHSALVERVYPGLAHGINSTELDDVRNFLVTHLAPTQ